MSEKPGSQAQLSFEALLASLEEVGTCRGVSEEEYYVPPRQIDVEPTTPVEPVQDETRTDSKATQSDVGVTTAKRT